MAHDCLTVEAVAAMLASTPTVYPDLEIRLYTDDYQPDASNLAAHTFSEPLNTDWYAPVPAVAGEVQKLNDGTLALHFQSVEFNYTSGDVDIVRGYFVKNTTVSNVKIISAQALSTPVTMDNVLKGVVVEPIFTLQPVEAEAPTE